MADIRLNASEIWTPIGNGEYVSFAGNFDGNGHTISDLYIYDVDGSPYMGLFGRFEEGTVKNLTVQGKISVTSSSASKLYVGGVAGYVSGSAVISDVTADMQIDAYLTSTATTDFVYAGGIVGYITDSAITGTSASGSIQASKAGSYGTSYAGGIAGYHDGDISDCANRADISVGFKTSGESEMSYPNSASPDTAYVGGLCGNGGGSSSHVYNNYNEGNLSVVNNSALNGRED